MLNSGEVLVRIQVPWSALSFGYYVKCLILRRNIYKKTDLSVTFFVYSWLIPSKLNWINLCHFSANLESVFTWFNSHFALFTD